PHGLMCRDEPAREEMPEALGRLLAENERLTRPTRRYAAAIWDRVGRALAATGGPAERALREAVRLAPWVGRSWNNLAVWLAREGRSAEARLAAERAGGPEALRATHRANTRLFRLPA